MWSIPATNPEGRAFITVLVIFVVIAVLTFGLRIYSRRLHKNILYASDYTCLSVLVSSNRIYVYLELRLIVIKVLDVGLVVIIWGSGLFYTAGLAASPMIFMGGF